MILRLGIVFYNTCCCQNNQVVWQVYRRKRSMESVNSNYTPPGIALGKDIRYCIQKFFMLAASDCLLQVKAAFLPKIQDLRTVIGFAPYLK